MGPLLSHVSTADTARDIDPLRTGIGEEKITYIGLSYGTVLGQTYLNMFPQHVRAMMLDSIVDGVPHTRAPRTGSGPGALPTRCPGRGIERQPRVLSVISRVTQTQDPGRERHHLRRKEGASRLGNDALWPDGCRMATAGATPSERARRSVSASTRRPCA